MTKVTALFLFTLFLCYMVTHASRPDPPFRRESLAKAQHQGVEGVEAVDDSCEGVGEDECLMRRTLAAHIDYIYTQHHNP